MELILGLTYLVCYEVFDLWILAEIQKNLHLGDELTA